MFKKFISKYIAKELRSARILIRKPGHAYITMGIIMALATAMVFAFGEILNSDFVVSNCAFIALAIELPEFLIIGMRLQELKNKRSD